MAASAARIAEVLAGLRSFSARLRTAAGLERASLPLGIPALDAALGGGLPRGRLTELYGPRSSGRLSITLGALASAQSRGELVALVDVADALDPRTAAAAGLALPRLLWVRPRSWVEGLKATDRVLDAGGFGLVVLYLCGTSGRVRGDAAWARLLKRAESARSAVLIATDRPLIGSFAAAALESRRLRPVWSTLLDTAITSLRITRSKLGPPTPEVGTVLGF